MRATENVIVLMANAISIMRSETNDDKVFLSSEFPGHRFSHFLILQ